MALIPRLRAQLASITKISGGIFAFVAVACTALPDRPQTASFFPTDAEIQALVRPNVDGGQIKGVVIGLVEPTGRRRIFSYGIAGQEARLLGPKSVFDIASISKTFTGAILADMVLRGEVALNDPASKYLPANVRLPSRNGKQITILHLAIHRSGLPAKVEGYSPPDPTNFFAEQDVDWLYRYLATLTLEQDPGSQPIYSNVGYALLGHILARAANAENFESLAQRRLLQPLGMTMTGFVPSPAMRPWMTTGHNGDQPVQPRGMKVFSASGGLLSTMDDMLTYLTANLGPAGTRIKQAMRMAHRPTADVPVPNMKMGLGWGILTRGEQTILMNAGGSSGYSSFIAFDPAAKAGVVILSNSTEVNSTIEAVGLGLLEGRQKSPPADVR